MTEPCPPSTAPIADRYEPAAVEARRYPEWERRGYFRSEPGQPGPPYKRTTEAFAFTRGKLSRQDFAERAPAEIVDKEREKLAEQEALHAKLVASLSWVG